MIFIVADYTHPSNQSSCIEVLKYILLLDTENGFLICKCNVLDEG